MNSTITLKDKSSGGKVWLSLRDGLVVGAMGSDPARFTGLTEDQARRQARTVKPVERPARVRTRDGDWFVATSSAQWAEAMARQGEAVQARAERMTAWEAEHRVDGYPPASYWEAFKSEKYRIAIDWAMPEGHVIFGGGK